MNEKHSPPRGVGLGVVTQTECAELAEHGSRTASASAFTGFYGEFADAVFDSKRCCLDSSLNLNRNGLLPKLATRTVMFASSIRQGN